MASSGPAVVARARRVASGRPVAVAGAPWRGGAYVMALRPHHWLKNVLLFVPMVLARAFTPEAAIEVGLAFVCMCLVASSGYLVNDLRDLAEDRRHPYKRHRPLASGAMPPVHARIMALALLLVALTIAAVALPIAFLVVLAVYYAMTLTYSMALKSTLIADVLCLAGLYVLRVAAGGIAASIAISEWLLAFSVFFFLMLALIKRLTELGRLSADELGSASRRAYRPDDQVILCAMATSSGFISVLVLALYLRSEEAISNYSTPDLLWLVCVLLLFWVVRLLMLTHRGEMHYDPVVYALTDRVSLTIGGLVLAVMAGAAFA